MAAHSDAEPTTTPAYDPEARDLARPEDRRKFAEWVAHIVRAAGDEEGAALIQAAGFMPNGVREAFPKTQRGGSEISAQEAAPATSCSEQCASDGMRNSARTGGQADLAGSGKLSCHEVGNPSRE